MEVVEVVEEVIEGEETRVVAAEETPLVVAVHEVEASEARIVEGMTAEDFVAGEEVLWVGRSLSICKSQS